MKKFAFTDSFVNRHIGPSDTEIKDMLAAIGVDSLDTLIDETIPPHIRLKEPLPQKDGISEQEFLAYIRNLASQNTIAKSYIGMGYYPTVTPQVIVRNILENPGWYTQYTPYQAEISQGRLEALMNFQTMIIDLTGLPIANASLLDEATAAAEAMLMLNAGSKKKHANKFFVDVDVFPQTLEVLRARAIPRGIEIVVDDYASVNLDDEYFGLFVQYPTGSGEIRDYTDFISQAKEKNIFSVVAADILSLTLLKAPGAIGADVCVGSTQRFGVPMGFGGPHAAYFATTEKFKRSIPGRIIGASVDTTGKTAFRMALQTREQHIRREKATSNICTAQVLLAIMAGFYAVYHGAEGLKAIARRIHLLTNLLDQGLHYLEFTQLNSDYFDTLAVKLDNADDVAALRAKAEAKNINFRYDEGNVVGISFGETTTTNDVKEILDLFSAFRDKEFTDGIFEELMENAEEVICDECKRQTPILEHPVFNEYRSEMELMRYMKTLENRDFSLVHGMIPLGSCTMKLNAAIEMVGVTMREFSEVHPFAPENQVKGYMQLITDLKKELAVLTGLPGVSLQPNSGAQGEYTGLMVIRQYHIDRGDTQRNVALIPSSAHGTNPASAVMAGMQVVVVDCDANGNIDVNDLKAKAEKYKDTLSAIMVTYPSTHGVFEQEIVEICDIIHKYGGQVYLDGANMNAQVGLTSPAMVGADVCHLNLHKTFAIPHGGGGPGMGPICTAEHLTPYLPNHPVVKCGGEKGIETVSAAPFGSASILVISLAYIKMLGYQGLTKSTKVAILSANYLKAKLEKNYDVLYSGKNNRVGHELIFDFRNFKRCCEIEVEDIAKRLMDYSFHAPTVSFPVPGTLMVEPTESESKIELDRFVEAMELIRKEIAAVEDGSVPVEESVLKNAPHSIDVIISEEWNHRYTREEAAFPVSWTKTGKFWPFVTRINSAQGDRNLVCSCNYLMEDFKEEA